VSAVATGSEFVRLDSVCRIIQGGRQKLTGKDFVAVGGYPAYGAGGHNGNLPSYEFDQPAIVLSAIGARCGKCFQPTGRWSSLANTSVLFPETARADVRFLWYQLNDESSWHRSGTAQPYIKPSDIKSRKVYLPPLAEQRRIAAILDAADALRQKRRESLAQLDTLVQSVFLDMFGDPVTNPMGWKSASLIQLCDGERGISYGVVQRGDHDAGGIPLIRIGDILSGRIEVGQLVKCSSSITSKYRRTVLHGGELVISIRGTVGRTAQVPVELRGGNVSREIALVPLKPQIVTEFVLALLRTDAVFRRLAEDVRGVAQRGINLRDLRELVVIQPPRDRQQHFADIVEAVERQRSDQEAHLAELDTLFASLQSRAFRGEL